MQRKYVRRARACLAHLFFASRSTIFLATASGVRSGVGVSDKGLAGDMTASRRESKAGISMRMEVMVLRSESEELDFLRWVDPGPDGRRQAVNLASGGGHFLSDTWLYPSHPRQCRLSKCSKSKCRVH